MTGPAITQSRGLRWQARSKTAQSRNYVSWNNRQSRECPQNLIFPVNVPGSCVLENGDIAEFDGKHVSKLHHASVERVHAFAGREIPNEVLKDRMQLGAGGVVVVSVQSDDISVRSLGVMGVDDADGVAAMKSAVKSAIDQAREQGAASKQAIGDAARSAVRRVAMKRLGYKPLVVVVGS